MDFVCDKSTLSVAVDNVSRAVTKSSSIPALEGILMVATGMQLTLTGYDLEMSITTTIESNVRIPGEVVLNAKLLSDMIHRMPAGDIFIKIDDNGRCTIRGGGAVFEIQSMMSGEFPSLPNTELEKETLTIQAGVLREMINKTVFAVSKDDKRPAHTGELLDAALDKFTIAALDGFRLAVVERPIACSKNHRVIAPCKTMTELLHILPSDDEEEVHIFTNRRFVGFKMNGCEMMSRVIEGEFLNYANVIPQGHKTRVIVDVKEFISIIERCSLIITERMKNPLRITFEKDKVTVRCQTNLGRVVDELDAKTEGDTVEIGFNNSYLLDALRGSGADEVAFEMNGAISPIKILPVEGNAFTYLVLPVRFKND